MKISCASQDHFCSQFSYLFSSLAFWCLKVPSTLPAWLIALYIVHWSFPIPDNLNHFIQEFILLMDPCSKPPASLSQSNESYTDLQLDLPLHLPVLPLFIGTFIFSFHIFFDYIRCFIFCSFISQTPYINELGTLCGLSVQYHLSKCSGSMENLFHVHVFPQKLFTIFFRKWFRCNASQEAFGFLNKLLKIFWKFSKHSVYWTSELFHLQCSNTNSFKNEWMMMLRLLKWSPKMKKMMKVVTRRNWLERIFKSRCLDQWV
jgi:hypothetical protein